MKQKFKLVSYRDGQLGIMSTASPTRILDLAALNWRDLAPHEQVEKVTKVYSTSLLLPRSNEELQIFASASRFFATPTHKVKAGELSTREACWLPGHGVCVKINTYEASAFTDAVELRAVGTGYIARIHSSKEVDKLDRLSYALVNLTKLRKEQAMMKYGEQNKKETTMNYTGASTTRIRLENVKEAGAALATDVKDETLDVAMLHVGKAIYTNLAPIAARFMPKLSFFERMFTKKETRETMQLLVVYGLLKLLQTKLDHYALTCLTKFLNYELQGKVISGLDLPTLEKLFQPPVTLKKPQPR